MLPHAVEHRVARPGNNVTGGVLRGTATVGDLTVTAAASSLARARGLYREIGRSAGRHARAGIERPAAGTQHDQVKATGAIALGNATLELLVSPDLVLSTLNPIVIVSNDTAEPDRRDVRRSRGRRGRLEQRQGVQRSPTRAATATTSC